ncbi:hypothetical protein M1328_00760 [Patescibacteria group bacterium]|nr:hypothetical protein [Patescibacteria group bacterium]
MKMPKSWTTVTPLSRRIALVLFFLLPLAAFFFGVNYQKMSESMIGGEAPLPTPTTYQAPIQTSSWCGEIAGNKPCPAGYACRFDLGSTTSGTCEKCPEVEFVDCMPGPGKYDSRCNPDYLRWAQSNCPNFKGAAY